MKIVDSNDSSLIVPDHGLYLVQSRYTNKKCIAFVNPTTTSQKYIMVYLITDDYEFPVTTISYSWLLERYNIFYPIRHIQMWNFKNIINLIDDSLEDGVYFNEPSTLVIAKDKRYFTIGLIEYRCNGEVYFRVDRENIKEYENEYVPEKLTYIYSINVLNF